MSNAIQTNLCSLQPNGQTVCVGLCLVLLSLLRTLGFSPVLCFVVGKVLYVDLRLL